MRKYKMAVFTDLDSGTPATLKNAIGLAKIINGQIEVFSVKKASEIVSSDNQLSAMRSINSKYIAYQKKMKALIEPISKQFDIPIDFSFSIGNIKNEISQYIDSKKPDIIVLGKRKDKVVKLVGDRITPFVLEKFKGVIMITNNKNIIEADRQISLGMFNNLGSEFNLEFAEDLIEHTQKPLKSFKIAQNSNLPEAPKNPSKRKIVEYVFEKSDGALKNVSTYLAKNKIDVLYVDRFKKQQGEKIGNFKSRINNIVDQLNVTLLLTGVENYKLQ